MDLDDLERVKLTREGGIWTVCLNRPHQDNRLDEQMHRELDFAFSAFQSTSDAAVAVLTAEGRIFSHGGEDGSEPLPPGGLGGLSDRALGKPIIAAVNGDAMNEGFELLLTCDLILSNENARFGLGVSARGRVRSAGTVPRLLRRVPHGKAVDMLLCGALMSAREGVLLGFVNEIAPRRQIVETAVLRAKKILEMPTSAISALKDEIDRVT